MRFRKLISGTQSRHRRVARHGRGQQRYAGLREAVQRCRRDDDDTRHVAYEDFDATGRALVDKASPPRQR